jgi:hypothetical protein
MKVTKEEHARSVQLAHAIVEAMWSENDFDKAGDIASGLTKDELIGVVACLAGAVGSTTAARVKLALVHDRATLEAAKPKEALS